MEDYSEKELEKIISGFLDKTLDKPLWTHQAHIITAIWHSMKFEKEDAICRMRSGIIAYNLATGGENNGQNGYHETITIFWFDVITQFLAQYAGFLFRDTCIKFLDSPMADKNFPFQFYTREKLLSATARSRFIVADLKAIEIYV